VQPVVLGPNQPDLFYRGGESIARFRGLPQTSGHRPEDWIGSTTAIFGTDSGRSVLPDGGTLKDAVAADPEGYLGPAHVAAYGPDTGLLVKLLDAGERLPVHLHPPRSFAEAHLGCPHGKTEAWIVIGTSGPAPEVYLGFSAPLSPDVVSELVAEQGQGDLLAALIAVPVKVGDVFFVPAGTPHSIGPGVFIVELQEPTDFSILMEFARYGIDGEARASLGLGFETALSCLDRTAWGPERLDAARGPGLSSDGSPRANVLPPQAAPFFRAERIQPAGAAPVELEPSFSILVVLDGTGTLSTGSGHDVDLKRGLTVLVPYAAGASTMSGEVVVIRCQPPARPAESG
jgi:mannose-6-phosphate isomerase